jgi:hypothetical protein
MKNWKIWTFTSIIAFLGFIVGFVSCDPENNETTDPVYNYIINPPDQTMFAVGSTNQTNDQKFNTAGFWATRDSADISVSCTFQWQNGSELKNGDFISTAQRGNQNINVILNSKIIGTFTISVITIEDFFGSWRCDSLSENIYIYDDKIYRYNLSDGYLKSDFSIIYKNAYINTLNETKSNYPVGYSVSSDSSWVYITLHKDKQNFLYGGFICVKQ